MVHFFTLAPHCREIVRILRVVCLCSSVICHIIWTLSGISSEYAISCCCERAARCRDQTDTFLSETAMNSMLKLARLLSVLRFVYPRKVFLDLTSFITTMTTLPCSVFHGAGLISVFTILSLVQLCGRYRIHCYSFSGLIIFSMSLWN